MQGSTGPLGKHAGIGGEQTGRSLSLLPVIRERSVKQPEIVGPGARLFLPMTVLNTFAKPAA